MKVKIVAVGPLKSGKTALSNLLSEVTDSQQQPTYRPTKGCRILEFEVANVPVDDKMTKVDVELWDCSGDTKYSSCWPAIANNCQGTMLVYDFSYVNPNELHYWYDYFIDQQGLRDGQCVVFQYMREGNQNTNKGRRNELGERISSLNTITISPNDDADLVRKEFHDYLTNVIQELSTRREQEELLILNS